MLTQSNSRVGKGVINILWWLSRLAAFVNQSGPSKNGFKTHIPLLILLLLLFFPRAFLALHHPELVIHTDARVRYIPALFAVESYWPNIFYANGPFHVLYLALLKLLFGSLKSSSVAIFQHVFGVIFASLIFIVLKRQSQRYKISVIYPFLLILFLFNSPLIIASEHSLLREHTILWVTAAGSTLFLFADYRSPLGRLQIFCALFLFAVASFIRMEAIVLWLLVFCVIIYNYIKAREFKIVVFNLVVFSAIFGLFFAGKSFFTDDKITINPPYGGAKFNIAFHYLRPQNFDYTSENYKQLVDAFSRILETEITTTRSMGKFYQATRDYMTSGNETKHYKPSNQDMLRVMDHVFLDQIFNNPAQYAKTYVINLWKVVDASGFYPKSVNTSSLVGAGWSPLYASLSKKIQNVVTPEIGLSPYSFLCAIFLVLCNLKMRSEIVHRTAQLGAIAVSYTLFLAFIANPVARFLMPISFIYALSFAIAIYYVLAKLDASLKRIGHSH